jgi:hypothetical protein
VLTGRAVIFSNQRWTSRITVPHKKIDRELQKRYNPYAKRESENLMPLTMNYQEWLQRTSLGITVVRPAKLRSVDYALNVYNRIPTEENQVVLRKALMAFIDDEKGFSGKGLEALKEDPQNGTNPIEELFAQVVLGRRILPSSRRLPFSLRMELLRGARGRVQAQIFGGYVQETFVGGSGEITRRKIKKVGHLHESDLLLGTVAKQIESGLDCKISYGPMKTLKSASRKVTDDYGGDWYQLKDGVRLTVIATNGGKVTGVRPDKLQAVRDKIRMVCVSNRGLSIIKDEEAKPGTPDNPCGYSGLNFVVRLSPGGGSGLTSWYSPDSSPGWPGEIQANIPALMYGKMSEEDLCSIFGQEGYASLKAEFAVEGGIAHVFYEIWREDRTGANGRGAAKLATRYHDYLRDPQGLQHDKAALIADIKAFKTASSVNIAKFGKKH